MQIITFLLLGFSLAATLGPITIETIHKGIKHGFYPAFSFNVGAVIGDGIHLLVIFFGLSYIADNIIFNIALTLFGVAVLLYLGIHNIKDAFGEIELNIKRIKSTKKSFIQVVIINTANPMAMICWVGFYGTVSATTKDLTNIKLLGNLGIVLLGALLWGFVLSLISHMGKRFANEKVMKVISIVAGLILIGFGTYLGLTLIDLL